MISKRGYLYHGAFAFAFIGAAAGFILILIWFMGVAVSSSPLESPEAHDSFIYLEPHRESTQGQVEMEMALLEDPAPLFLPTEWNFLNRSQEHEYALPPTRQLFAGFGSRLIFESRKQALLPGPREAGPYARPEDVLNNSDWSYFTGFGEKDAERPPPLPTRTGAYRLTRFSDGMTHKEGILTLREDAPEAPVDWRPLEMLIMVDALGMSGHPLALSGSGHEDWDAVLEEWVLYARFWVDLPPGYFHLTIGP